MRRDGKKSVIWIAIGLMLIIAFPAFKGIALAQGDYRSDHVYSMDQENEMKKVGHKYSLAMSQPVMGHPWCTACTNSFEEAAKRYNLKKFVWTDGKNDAAKQLADVEDLIAQKPDAIMLRPLVKETLTPAWGKAQRAKIPLILWDREIGGERGKDFVTWIGWDSTKFGTVSAEALVKALNQRFGEYKGNIAYIRGTVGASVFEDRHNGAMEVFKKYPKIKIIAEQDADCMRDNAMRITENYLQMFPKGKIDALFCEDDEEALGAIQAIKAAKRDELLGWIASIDGQRDGLEAIMAGEMLCTAAASPFFGNVTIMTALSYLEGKKVPPTIKIDFEVYDTKEKAAAGIARMKKYNTFW